VVPRTETCNALDDNCNGTADDPFRCSAPTNLAQGRPASLSQQYSPGSGTCFGPQVAVDGNTNGNYTGCPSVITIVENGMGWWQVALIVGISMTIAAALDVGPLLITQAGVQGLIVALLSANSTLAFGRWFEALIGSTVGLAFAAIVPTSTVLRPRVRAIALLRDVSDVLTRTAAAMTHKDQAAVEKALVDARATEVAFNGLKGVTADSREILRLTPLSTRRKAAIATVASMLEPLDRAIRNMRVLNRRAAVCLQTGEDVPAPYIRAVAELGAATEMLVHHVERGTPPPGLRAELLEIATHTGARAPGATLSAEVIRAQVRSMLVDYLMIIGDTAEEARAQVRSVCTD
jgi:hypothetical protein